MVSTENFKSQLLKSIETKGFESCAWELFQIQAQHNAIYSNYLRYLNRPPERIQKLEDIPFLPIQFFKSHLVQTYQPAVERIFTSSGTTGQQASRHAVADVDWYHQLAVRTFEAFYGSMEECCFLCLLPSYLEREGSSLIEMCRHFIECSADTDSGFYLHNQADLYAMLQRKQSEGVKTVLIGVSFALLDFAEHFNLDFPELIVMETGGMKGRREELTREALHAVLKPAFGVSTIHAEYGMTELLSQAYSKGGGFFETAPWMRVQIRRTDDPFSRAELGKTGGLNIIDLANVDSCAFIETMDLGRLHENNTFEVLGRFDHAEVRGCNLMIQTP